MTESNKAGQPPAPANASETDEELSRIGEMAKTFGVSLRTLRFYEDKGLLAPKREGSTRLYTKRDRARMKLIMLGRKVGFSLRDVKQIMDLYDPGGSNTRQMKLALEKSEKQMTRLHQQREQLDEAVKELGDLIGFVRDRIASPANTSTAPLRKAG